MRCRVQHAANLQRAPNAAALPERRSGDTSHALSDSDLANSLCKARGHTQRTPGRFSASHRRLLHATLKEEAALVVRT